MKLKGKNKLTLIFLVILLACAGVPQWTKKGIDYYSRGDYEAAIGVLKKSIEKNPGYARTHFYLGQVYEAEGDYIDALSEYQNYSQQIRGGKRMGEVKIAIERVKNMLMEKDYEETIKTGNIDSYKAFLKKYQDSKYTTEIRTKLEDLEFATAMLERGIEALSNFLNDFPDSKHFPEARETLHKLKADADFTKAISEDRLDLYEEFLREYPENEYIPKVKQLIIDYYKLRNLGPVVNTRVGEYLPCISPDGKSLYFCACDREGGIEGEDIWLTEQQNGKWGLARCLSQPLNSNYNEAPMAITANNDMILLGFCNRWGGEGSCDIWFSTRKGDEWSEPQNIGPPINSPGWEARASISADGQRIFFSADPDESDPWKRTGRLVGHRGQGGVDIWMSEKIGEGWSQPKNLGPVINTSKDEFVACIHADDKTLYFASDGHGGYGRLDLFKSTLQNGHWSTPVNLGPLINTKGNEESFSVPGSGDVAYFSSSGHGGYGSEDLFQIKLPPETMPAAVTIVSGKILDRETQKPLEADIEWENLKTNKIIAKIKSNAATGRYVVVLPSGEHYGLTVSANDYLFHSENFDLTKLTKYQEVEKNIALVPVKVGASIIVNNIFFDFDKANIRPESKSELNRLVEIMKNYPTIKVEISGHTCSLGTDEYNQKLSEERAKNVKAYLTQQGVGNDRIVAKGYGKTRPIASNETEESRQLNRRTEFKIIGK